MTLHEARCALALDQLIERPGRCKRPRPSARQFVRGMATRARAVLAGDRAYPLTARQTHWLLTLTLEHAGAIRRPALLAETRALLGRDVAA